MSGSSSSILNFLMLIGKLKTTPRAGWLKYNFIQNAESVAEHTYRMAVMSMMIGDKHNVNITRCMKLALVHDMAECIVGDITPDDNISKQDKHKMEATAMDKIQDQLPPEFNEDLVALWREYEDQLTPEAQLVKDFDKFEMILQAFEYEQTNHKEGQLQDFFNSIKGRIVHPLVQSWVEQLEQARNSTLIDQETTKK